MLPSATSGALRRSATNPRAVGWLSPTSATWASAGVTAKSEYENLAIMQSWVNELRAKNDGRFL